MFGLLYGPEAVVGLFPFITITDVGVFLDMDLAEIHWCSLSTLPNRQTERHTLDELAFLSHLLCPKICIEGFSPPMDRCQVTDIDNAGSF